MNSLLEQYPVVLTQEVIWGDMDAFAHVNNTVYFRYFEDVRIAYFNKIEVHKYKQEANLGPILASTQCDFKLPLQYPDTIHIGTRSTLLSDKKFNMEYVVYSEKYQAVAAQGEGLVVFYDYGKGKSCVIPEAIVTAMGKLQG